MMELSSTHRNIFSDMSLPFDEVCKSKQRISDTMHYATSKLYKRRNDSLQQRATWRHVRHQLYVPKA
jgi:hypothetical protein